jgi:hypothetical protein
MMIALYIASVLIRVLCGENPWFLKFETTDSYPEQSHGFNRQDHEAAIVNCWTQPAASAFRQILLLILVFFQFIRIAGFLVQLYQPIVQ